MSRPKKDWKNIKNLLCTTCNTTKPIVEFYKTNRGTYRALCKSCNASKARRYRITEAGRKSYKKAALKKYYGITYEEYQKLLDKANNHCQMCHSKFADSWRRNLAVDHCHRTNKIRGILCGKCNWLVGYYEKFLHDPHLVSTIRTYLRIEA